MVNGAYNICGCLCVAAENGKELSGKLKECEREREREIRSGDKDMIKSIARCKLRMEWKKCYRKVFAWSD